MATTITTDYSGEKRLSSSAPNLSNEDFNPEGLQSGNLDPSSRDEDRGLDNTGIKSISKRIEPLPGTPQHETSNNAELPPEPAAEQPGLPGKDYSILTVAQKRTIVVAASFAALFSPMATAIYYPSLDTISHELNVSNSSINITVTVFLVIQGIAPAFVADLADRSGRRPMYVFCFVVFSVANIGLALQNSYSALLVLRMLQAAGSSGTVALANGVVGDVVTSSERGSYIAFASLGGMLGPMIAPILGGIIGQYAGWHWIFWFLLILSAVIFIPLIFFMPETCRGVVDDGSIPPPYLSNNLTDIYRHKKRAKAGIIVDEEKRKKLHTENKFRLPNPLSAVVVLLDLESALILIATGLGVGCFYAVSTGASNAFSKLFGFNQLQVSLMFIPVGAGSIISALTSGKLVDWNYRRHALRLGLPVVRNRAQDLTDFPIEKARLEVAFPMFFAAGAFIIMYGWFLTVKLNIAAYVVSLFFAGYCLTSTFQILNVLMVDIYPGKPSTATAANNLVRCEIGAVFSAILLPLERAIGWGWSYTFLALLFVGFAPILLILIRKGPKWRKAKKAKEEEKREAKRDKAERHGQQQQ